MSICIITFIAIQTEWLSTRACIGLMIGFLLTIVADGLWILLDFKEWGLMYYVQHYESDIVIYYIQLASLGTNMLLNTILAFDLFWASRLFLTSA